MAIAAALALAALAVWLWQAHLPQTVPRPPARSAFTRAQIDRATAYRGPQYVLALAALVASPAAAVAWARWGRPLVWARLPPAPAAGFAAAATATVAAAAVLPLSYVDHVRAANVGLDLRSFDGWARDAAIALGASGLAVAAGYTVCAAVARRTRRPSLAVGLVAWATVALLVLLQPVVLDPLFSSTRPIADPGVRALVSRAEAQVGAQPASVTVSDASARTTEENAYVDGLGPTERIVLYDTVLRHAPADQTEALLAHELAHVKRRHVLKAVLWFGVLGLPALWAVLAVAGRLARRRGVDGFADPRAAPLVTAGLIVAASLLVPVENTISRRYEAEADWVALRATGDGAGMAGLQRRLAVADLANPEPPQWAVWLLFDHPPVMERIGVARAEMSDSQSP